jgi:ADP-heptose:LPS heptosyltransferase
MDFEARRVLLCMRYGIGDVAMELPVLEALRRALPQAHITALGASPATQLLERHPDLDAVDTLNQWGIRHRWDRGPAGAKRAISAWLDEHDFDLFLDVHHVTPAFGEVVWSRGIRSLEADEAAERAAVQRGESGVAAIKHAVRAGWGLDVPQGTLPRVATAPDDQDFADHFLHRFGLGGTAPLAISPVASLSLKRWPMERLARVADDLVEETGEPVLLFCGPQEDAGNALRSQMRHARRVVCVGPLHLLRVAALLERCRAFVCNDTGLMHLAGALGVPTVAIFGPTAASIYRPPGDWVVSAGGDGVECPHHNTASLHPPACFAEGHCLIADRSCIHRTTEEDVRTALHGLLGRLEGQAQPNPSVA